MRCKFLFFPVSALTLLPGITCPSVAQTTSNEPNSTDVIVVTANRTPRHLSSVGQSISVIDTAELERRQSTTVADVLRTVPGVSIARNGGIGSLTSVFIRGAESDQTVALIDGVKLNDPSAPGGGFDFGNLLVGNIERIEVLRGPSSVLWGSQAIGGVVNLITRQPTDHLSVNARSEYGYRNTVQTVANIADKVGPLSVSGGGGYFRSDGISAFSAARGGQEKDGYRNYGATLLLGLDLTSAITLEARGYYSNGTVGIDGFAPPTFTFGDTRETSRTREFVGYTGVKIALLDGRLRNRLGYAYTDISRHNFNPDSTLQTTFIGNGRNERLEYQGVFDIKKSVQLTFGAEREVSRYNTSSFGGPVTRGRDELDSGYGQIVLTPFTGLTATGGVRYDSHDRFGSATTFAASGVWTPERSDTTFRASYSQGFKAPSLFQLQSQYGNLSLRPERSRGWDAGVSQKLLGGAVQASATYFARNTVDLIDFVSCVPPLSGICTNRPFGTYNNVARARADGVELGLVLQPVSALRLQANYSYTNAVNRSSGDINSGRVLLRRPQHTFNTLIDYQWGFGLETGATLTHVGPNFEDAGNTLKVQGYVLADLRASYPVTPQIEVYGRIENLFNEQYETILRYGTPGRAGYIGIRLHI